MTYQSFHGRVGVPCRPCLHVRGWSRFASGTRLCKRTIDDVTPDEDPTSFKRLSWSQHRRGPIPGQLYVRAGNRANDGRGTRGHWSSGVFSQYKSDTVFRSTVSRRRHSKILPSWPKKNVWRSDWASDCAACHGFGNRTRYSREIPAQNKDLYDLHLSVPGLSVCVWKFKCV